MSKVVRGHFRQNHLRELALDILDCIDCMVEERGLSVPEALGVLELVKTQIIDDARELEEEE